MSDDDDDDDGVSFAFAILVGLLCAVLAMHAGAVRQAYAHDHWINKGHYLSPTTQQHCCNENDCKPIPASEIASRIVREGDFLIVDKVHRFRVKDVLKSEDEFWYRCASRCLFSPFQG